MPYPFSADNHQVENARFVEKSAAGICVLQSNIDTLENEILELASNEQLREKMRKNLELIDQSNSISKMISDIEQRAKFKGI